MRSPFRHTSCELGSGYSRIAPRRSDGVGARKPRVRRLNWNRSCWFLAMGFSGPQGVGLIALAAKTASRTTCKDCVHASGFPCRQASGALDRDEIQSVSDSSDTSMSIQVYSGRGRLSGDLRLLRAGGSGGSGTSAGRAAWVVLGIWHSGRDGDDLVSDWLFVGLQPLSPQLGSVGRSGGPGARLHAQP